MRILLALLLMTGVCWGHEFNIKNAELGVETFNNISISDWALKDGKTIKIACPDGYYLEGKLWNRYIEVYGITARNTDAKLKCVKEDSK